MEDNCAATRVYALRSLMNIGPIALEDLRALGYGIGFSVCPSRLHSTLTYFSAVIQRLDDPSVEVRDWAARSITKICVNENVMEKTGQNSVNAYMTDIFSSLFLHFEGPELKLRNTIKSIIKIS